MSEKADWFFASGYLGSLYRSPDDVIELRVADVARVLFRHARPLIPLASIAAPHMHVWGWHRFVPMRMPVATRMASSDSLRPTDVKGGACSQSSACGLTIALSLA